MLRLLKIRRRRSGSKLSSTDSVDFFLIVACLSAGSAASSRVGPGGSSLKSLGPYAAAAQAAQVRKRWRQNFARQHEPLQPGSMCQHTSAPQLAPDKPTSKECLSVGSVVSKQTRIHDILCYMSLAMVCMTCQVARSVFDLLLSPMYCSP